MSIIEIILVAIGLAMDASAVSMAAAAAGYAKEPRQVFRLAFHFGLFQGFMPFIGWILGTSFVHYIEAWDHWIAFILLAIVGGRMVYEGRPANINKIRIDPTRGWSLITLSVATSIDALAVGLSFSMLSLNILIPCLLIGFVTLVLSILSTQVGKSMVQILGNKVEIAGGLILVGIGFRILFTHLTN